MLAADGVTVRSASSYGNQYGFTGRYLDKETGLWYFRARYYSGSLGRFVSRDPAGYVDGYLLYGGYFIPNALDPFGKETWDDFEEVDALPEGGEGHDAVVVPIWDDASTSELPTCSCVDDKSCAGGKKWTCTVATKVAKIDTSYEFKVKKGAMKTDNLLTHEMGHKEISERYARATEEIIKKIIGTATDCSKQKAGDGAGDDWQKKETEAYDKGYKDMDKEQEEYDKDTDHGKNKDKQKEWNEKLKKGR